MKIRGKRDDKAAWGVWGVEGGGGDCKFPQWAQGFKAGAPENFGFS